MAALKDFFTKQVRLKRDAQGLRFVLEDATIAVPAGDAKAIEPAPDPAFAMRDELVALLDLADGSRRVVRHLAAIEHELVHRDHTGLSIFEKPATRLKTAMRELDALRGEQASRGLAELRDRFVAAIAAHEARDRDIRLQQPLSSFLNDDKLQVNEARHSDFDKASAAWLEPPAGGASPPEK